MIRHRSLSMLLLTIITAFPSIAASQTQPSIPPTLPLLSPGTEYDPGIPTLEQVAGHDFGNEITPPVQIEQYLKALAEASDHADLIQYGATWEGRPLYMLVIATPERIADMERIKNDLRKLSDPRAVTEAEATRLMEELPVVSVFMHAVHGAEISPSGAAMAEAYHLLAARNDPGADLILNESIVLIDPNLNPDGRARIISNNLEGRALAPDPHPLSAEHDEPWPGGRVNHYIFDMNRDWFAQTQKETRARVAFLRGWAPHVMVDLHEMGSGEGTFFFPPPAPTDNPLVSEGQHQLFERIGRTIAERFDNRGYGYFTREGYAAGRNPNGGSSWPLAHGILGMLFEQATPISLIHRRQDGTILTYQDGVLHHFTAALATAETAARNRKEILSNYYDYRKSAIAEGQTGNVRAYLISSDTDPGQARRAAQTLVRNGVEVLETTEQISSGNMAVPAGAFIVPLAQPAGRVARNLLTEGTTWNLPGLYAVTGTGLARMPDVTTVPVTIDATPSTAPLPLPRVAYLMPWNATTAATVAEAMQAGIKVRTARRELVIAGRTFSNGLAVIRASDNSPDLLSTFSAIASRHGVDVTAVDSGFPDAGISLGSNAMKPLLPPRVLLGWDAPSFKYSAGWTRYVLEQRYGQPVTVIRIPTLNRVNFHDFDVVILPSTAVSYSDVLKEETIRRLTDWVATGGTLITLGEASRWAAMPEIGLIDRPVDLPLGQVEGYADAVSRSLLRLQLNRRHWLASGTDGTMQMLSSARRVFLPASEATSVAVGMYGEMASLVAGGRLPEAVQAKLAGQPVIVHRSHGNGQIVAFLEEPNGFGYAEGTGLLFINAVLLGPGYLR